MKLTDHVVPDEVSNGYELSMCTDKYFGFRGVELSGVAVTVKHQFDDDSEWFALRLTGKVPDVRLCRNITRTELQELVNELQEVLNNE